jgi:hypothetical protein
MQKPKATSARISGNLANHLPTLGFSDDENGRMHDLAEKNKGEGLSKAESEELDNYIKVGDLLAILQSRARMLVRKKPAVRRHG